MVDISKMVHFRVIGQTTRNSFIIQHEKTDFRLSIKIVTNDHIQFN